MEETDSAASVSLARLLGGETNRLKNARPSRRELTAEFVLVNATAVRAPQTGVSIHLRGLEFSQTNDLQGLGYRAIIRGSKFTERSFIK